MGDVFKKVAGGIGDIAKKAAPLAGLIPGGGIAASVLGGLPGFLGKQFEPSQTAVSGVPPELQSALEAAGISIEELIQSGGSLPQFGGRTGTDPNADQLAASSGLREQIGTPRTGPDLTDFNSILEQLRNSGADLSTSDSILSQLQGLQGPDTGRAAGLLDRVEGLATGPEQQRLIDTLLPSLEQATAANRFDLTDTFREGEAVFKSDLDERLADLKAESSALGLGAGSSDRNKRLLETAGRELGRFRLGQEDLSRRSFESAEGRRIAAINAGGTVSGAISRPSETLASIVPAALQEGGVGANFDLQKLLGSLDPSIRAALGAGGLEQAGLAAAINPALQAGQVGARFDLAQRGQNTQDLTSLFGFGTTERGFGESEIDRLMAEFGRTQTGGFDLLQGLLGSTPGQSTAFGPSNVSQLGNLASGVSSAFPGLFSKNQPAGSNAEFGGFGSFGNSVNNFSEGTASNPLSSTPNFGGDFASVGAPPPAAGSGLQLPSFNPNKQSPQALLDKQQGTNFASRSPEELQRLAQQQLKVGFTN